MYDPSKENDKDVLREQLKFLQEEVIELRKVVLQREEEKRKDEEILQKLSEELKNIRTRVFDSKQERKNKQQPKKKRKKVLLPHNRPSNFPLDELEVALDEELL